MDQHDFGQRAGKILEQAISAADLLVPLSQRIEQSVDRVRELRCLGVVRNRQPVTHRRVA